jgi:hypothetical protein
LSWCFGFVTAATASTMGNHNQGTVMERVLKHDVRSLHRRANGADRRTAGLA